MKKMLNLKAIALIALSLFPLASLAVIKSPGSAASGLYTVFQSGVPFIYGPSGFMTATGGVVLGQAPSTSATATFGATSGSTTVTFSAATLLGTASDVGRVVTILDTTYKYCTITAQSSTTVATCTVSGGTLSGVGPFANNVVWLSGTTQALGNTVTFAAVLPAVYANAYFYLPASSPTTVAGWYFCQFVTTTVGTCYNNIYTTGTVTIPSSPTAFSGLTPAQYTQTTGATITGPKINVAANSLGLNGGIEWDFSTSANNSANNHQWTCRGGAGTLLGTLTTTTTTSVSQICRLRNAGSATSNTLSYWPNQIAPVITYGVAFDTSVANDFYIAVNLTTQYDYMVLASYAIRVFPQ